MAERSSTCMEFQGHIVDQKVCKYMSVLERTLTEDDIPKQSTDTCTW